MESKKINRTFLTAAICLLAVFLASCFYRGSAVDKKFALSDATYHVLLTMQAYEDSGLSVHSLLPIQTYGAEYNKHINNGPSLIQDKNGNSFYVSFSPMGFYAPYLFCKLLGLPLTVSSIYIFNCLLMLVSASLCARLVYIVFRRVEFAGVAFVAYIFIPEVMFTQGIVYWHHSLSQVFLLLQLVLFHKLVFGNPKNKLIWQSLFLAVRFIYPYIEWTGFISNVGFAICIFLNGFHIERAGDRNRIAYNHVVSSKMIVLGAVTAAALAYFLWRFSKIAPASQIISSLSGRANSRSAAGYANLFRGYFDSFGPLLILTAITLIVTAVVTPSRMKFLQLMRDRRIVVLLISALVPIFENMLLRGHAIVYTFDRLKFAPFLIVIFILTIDSLRSIRHKILIGGGILYGLIIFAGVGLYKYGCNKIFDFGEGYQDSLALRDYLNKNYLNNNQAILVKNGWRAWGFLQTMYHRNIFCTALYNEKNLLKEADVRNSRYVIYLTGRGMVMDTGVYDYAEVLDTVKGTILTVKADNGNIAVKEKNSITASRLTDQNWTKGIRNTDHRTVLFENTMYNLKKLTGASTVTVGNETFWIKSMGHDDNWIHIVLDREADIVAYPNNLVVK